MKLIVEKDYDGLSKRAAQILIDGIKENPKIVLGLATGSTPKGMYRELIGAYERGEIDFSQVTTFNLDEYIGLNGNHPSSYRYFMVNQLFNHINIREENTHVPNGKAQDIEEYCRHYDKYIEESGGIDIQVLGIGTNGHIAFLEPARELSIGTTVTKLTQSTIEDNSRFFDNREEIPCTTITVGMGTILRARKVLLLANGKNKAPIMKELLNRKTITTDIPASLLLLHPDLTVIVDEEAYGR